MKPPARWDAGTPGWRVNNLKSAPETADFPNSARDPPGVEWAGSPPSGEVVVTPAPGAVTELLRAWSDGDEGALERLLPLMEAELRRLARWYMGRERRDHTLQVTALVNEGFLRLTDARRLRWQDARTFWGSQRA